MVLDESETSEDEVAPLFGCVSTWNLPSSNARGANLVHCETTHVSAPLKIPEETEEYHNRDGSAIQRGDGL